MKNRTCVIWLLCSFIIFAVILSGGTAYTAQEKNRKETRKKADSCITSKCHAKMGKDKFVHGPIAAGECTACHGTSKKHKDNPKRNKFGKVKDIEKTCYSCHEKFKTKKFIHVPVQDGECLVCHDPHGSPNKFQLVAKGGKLCFECHDEELVSGEFVHGPAAVGGCIACHEPHTADYEKGLRAKGPGLCFTCHVDKGEAFQKAQVTHKPVSEDCTKCHNPHSAAKEFMLSNSTPKLCYGCHKDKKKWVESIAVQHGALTKDKSCLNCHDVHVSQVGKMLSMPPMDLCMSCHDKEIERKNDKPLTNMKELFAENTNHHGPIKQKDCSGCHDAHGSNNFRILRNPYPPTFYMPFVESNYNLCFGCHEKSLVKDPETSKLTDFRNGRVNLHFKHVNKPEKGRTCRACHETHASNFPKHIRESVPFGSWELPLNYEKTKTGGSCTPGCHKIKKYDRAKKEINK